MIKESKLLLLVTQEMNETQSPLKNEAGKNGNTLPITLRKQTIFPHAFTC